MAASTARVSPPCRPTLVSAGTSGLRILCALSLCARCASSSEWEGDVPRPARGTKAGAASAAGAATASATVVVRSALRSPGGLNTTLIAGIILRCLRGAATAASAASTSAGAASASADASAGASADASAGWLAADSSRDNGSFTSAGSLAGAASTVPLLCRAWRHTPGSPAGCISGASAARSSASLSCREVAVGSAMPTTAATSPLFCPL